MKHKACMAALSGVFALLSSVQVNAAPPPAELEVKGMLKTPGCIVTAGTNNDGIYDYQKISPTLIAQGKATTALEVKSQTWIVRCDAPTFLLYQLTDNRGTTASVQADDKYGLGSVNGTGKLGYYQINTRNLFVDGDKVNHFYGSPGASTGYSGGAAVDGIRNGSVWKHGWTSDTGSVAMPKAGKEFTVDIEVAPYLAGTADMGGAITEDVHLDGYMTIGYSFGL